MSAMWNHSLALLIAALSILPTTVHAQSVEVMSVHGLAFDESGDGLAVQVDAGILLFDETEEVTFLCSSAWQAEGAHADWLVQTGARRPLIAGPAGPFIALEAGCQWARTSGPADSANVVGVHAPEPGGLVVLFAVTSEFGPDEVLRTDDGGFTSSSAGGFAQLDRILGGLVGDGARMVLAGENAITGDLVAWLSEDSGETFEEIALDAKAGDLLLGLGGLTVWLANDTVVTAYDLTDGGALHEVTLESSLMAYAVEPSGAVWLATSDGRLHHHDTETGADESYDVGATSITVHGEQTWIGLRAEQPGEPLVKRLDPGETDWIDVALRPMDLGYPQGCETLQAQICSEDAALLLPPVTAEPDPVPAAAVDSDGGCAGGPGGGRFPLELCVFLLLFVLVARRRELRRNGSPSASP